MRRIALLLSALLLALALCAGAAAAEDALLPGGPFPDFTVTDTEGNPFTLSEALKNHEAVLINFWATWCTPCGVEFPYLQAAWEKYGDRVAFVALSADDNDTMEMVSAYRESHGITFPMAPGGEALYGRTGSQTYPTSVIVDRFGSVAFLHTSAFKGAGEVERCLAGFLGVGYTPTAGLREISRDSSFRIFPVAAERGASVENEGAKTVLFRVDDDPEPILCFIVPEGKARVRLVPAAGDDVNSLVFNDLWGSFVSLADLLDPDLGAFVCVQATEGTYGGTRYPFNIGALLDVRLESDPDALLFFLVSGEEDLPAVEADLRSGGAQSVRWEYAQDAAEDEGQAYVLRVADQDGHPVAGLYVNFCTDAACTMLQSGSDGIITFDGPPDRYHVQLLRAPKGYSFDRDFEMYVGPARGEWQLRLRRD